MNDRKIKETAAEILRNKDRVFRFLNYLRPEDIERGTLILPDQLVNKELKDFIIDRTAPYLINYLLTSTAGGNGQENPSGLLYLDLELQIKQLGKLQARYMISISDLAFTQESRRLAFSYREGVKCLGNPLQVMALKALIGDKTLLVKAAEMAGLTGSSPRNGKLGPIVSADRQTAVVDLARLSFSLPSFLDCVALRYEGAGKGFLRFHFTF